MLKRMDITVVSACAAHLLTWCAGLWLAFGPVYQGVFVTPTVPGGVESSATRHTATLVEQNGLWIIWLLILPLLITGLVLLAIRLTDTGQLRRKVLLWTPALSFLAFCAVGIFSIGLFYLPSGLALMCAAITGSVGRPGPGDIGLTPRAKKVIELAVDEARRLSHQYVGTEHLLIGIMREGEGVAARVLESMGVNLERVRADVARLSQNSE